MGELIRNTPELETVCAKIRAGGFVALDTEFVWRRTFRPLLCIVQLVGEDGDCRAVDCLTGLDPAPLGALLSDPGVVKVLHASQQDLEHLRHYTGQTPVNVFDTQVAAAFAGFKSNMGLQKLLFEAINVGLPKTETLTDWSQRPLTAGQIEYALDDVRFLARLRADLLRRADELGTRSWLDEEMASLDDPDRYADLAPEDAWLRVKTGSLRLSRADWAVLRELAAVREERARIWNLPKQWLTEDVSLADLAIGGAESPRMHFRHRLKNNGLRDSLVAEYLHAYERGRALPEEEWPDDPRPRYITEVREAAEAAVEWLAARAEQLHIDAQLIANRGVVTAFVNNVDDESIPLAQGWRYEVAGREMAEKFVVD